MGDTAHALGLPTGFDFEGKHYNIAPQPRYDVQAHFEVWLEQRARAALKRAKQTPTNPQGLSEEEYQSCMTALTGEIAAGAYSFGTAISAKAMTTQMGQKQLLYLMLKAEPQEHDVDMPLVEKIFAKMLDEVMQILAEMNDPNFQAPAPGAGSPSAPSSPGSATTPGISASEKSAA
jgi:hypothetical protein